MRAFILQHFDHVLCGLLLFARTGDVLTTWWATPKMRLEANPVVKKLGWLYAIATIFTCFLAYYRLSLAFVLLGASLCVCASNASKIWMARTMGEDAFHKHSVELIKRSGLASAIFFNCLPALFYIVLGLTFRFLDSEPYTWGYHLGTGIFAFGIAILVFFPRKIYRLYVESKRNTSA
jgi:hypothetical protein